MPIQLPAEMGTGSDTKENNLRDKSVDRVPNRQSLKEVPLRKVCQPEIRMHLACIFNFTTNFQNYNKDG